ncbi:MAG: aldehyde dehydrogenase family protein, partial [Candidatus Neomarinimicrobiota bacterium]|nr:aldehyde dehydrogenase family protein [Candidatus Neomarinimicrobiota bacterium]
GPGITCTMTQEPLGVVAGITPFNFPAMVPLWMIPLALTTGNCFILKPSEQTPLSTFKIAEYLKEAGLPDGVFNIINGAREVVEGICDHPDIKAVAFVGSSHVAKIVYSRSTANGKRALCLGGAKNHMIVVPDADQDSTAKGLLASSMGSAGQRCMAASVAVGVADVDPIIEQLVEEAKSYKLGVDMGTIVSKAALDRITNYIDEAEKMGAKVLIDGRNSTPPEGYENGYWLGATILDGVDPNWPSATDEIFGPVLSIIRTDTLENAMKIENSNQYGNAAAVFTTSGQVAKTISESASAGMIGINIGVPVPREPYSFGGWNESKYGHGDMTGKSGVDFWTNLKKITARWPESKETWKKYF